MNDRKQQVLKMAHQLFLEKGFQATSIQDILDRSGISKGTFYNYFQSKNELLISIIKMLQNKMVHGRNELLIGQDASNIEVFIQQIEFQLKMNKSINLIPLFEELFFSQDEELKRFIHENQFKMLQWLIERFTVIYGKSAKPYLLDCAVMFMGMLHHNMKYDAYLHDSYSNLHHVVRYTVNRITAVLKELSTSKEQLFSPSLLDRWFLNLNNADKQLQRELYQTIAMLKNSLSDSNEQEELRELLDFVQDELLHETKPRTFLINSALLSLRTSDELAECTELYKLEELVASYFAQTSQPV